LDLRGSFHNQGSATIFTIEWILQGPVGSRMITLKVPPQSILMLL
jgi:hypothetical protein